MSLEGNWLFLLPRVDFEFSANVLPSCTSALSLPTSPTLSISADTANYKINVSSCIRVSVSVSVYLCVCLSMYMGWQQHRLQLQHCKPKAQGPRQAAKTRRILHKTRDKALQQQTHKQQAKQTSWTDLRRSTACTARRAGVCE